MYLSRRGLLAFLASAAAWLFLLPYHTRQFQEIPPREPASPRGEPRQRFTIRGAKGWAWTPAQYLEEIPYLAEFKMNFLMNCYASVTDIEHYAWGQRGVNRWWEPLPSGKARAFERIVRACQARGIEFCFSMNPNIFSERFADPDSPKDIDALWQHYSWMQSFGVRWFSIALDDIGQGVDASMHARLVNTIFERLRKQDGDAHMIFVPTWYWGDGRGSERGYLETLAHQLHPDVSIFWTGEKVISPRITRASAESYRAIVGHRLFLWDNYPVNDGQPTMHLGPLVGRDPDLCEVVDGYMSNPMRTQNRLNRVPLMTCADYAYDPASYNPSRAIEHAIARFSNNEAQRAALKDLIDTYPGMLVFGANQYFNPVRENFTKLVVRGAPSREAEQYLARIRDIASRFSSAFGNAYPREQETIDADVRWLERIFAEKYVS